MSKYEILIITKFIKFKTKHYVVSRMAFRRMLIIAWRLWGERCIPQEVMNAIKDKARTEELSVSGTYRFLQRAKRRSEVSPN